MPTRRQLLLAPTILGLGASRTTAQPAPLPAPGGPVVLTMTGRIARTNVPGAARFDRAMLAALPQGSFTGETPWTKGRVTFSGPLGAALLDLVGAQGTMLKVVALNDYASEVPVEDFRKHQVILATHRDGTEMAVRDKGPLWIIYPMDRDASLRNAVVYHRSVWQIRDIEVA
jgi:hypothetical protein